MTYPVEISDDETIVRVIKTPFHLNGSRKALTPAAFRPPKNRHDVSVVRWRYALSDPSELKAKVKEIANGAYAGVAHLTCLQVRSAPAGIEDSRQYFQGHADILILGSMPLQEPAEGEEAKRIKEVTKALAEAATYLADTKVDSDTWTISQLPPPEPIEQIP